MVDYASRVWAHQQRYNTLLDLETTLARKMERVNLKWRATVSGDVKWHIIRADAINILALQLKWRATCSGTCKHLHVVASHIGVPVQATMYCITQGKFSKNISSSGKNSDESEDRPKVLVKKRKGKQEERGKREDKWKLSEIETFLELYELYRCLWDYKVDEYKDKNAKEHEWEEIVRGMEKREFTVKKAKDKIRVLRNT
ncbi:hypothetical protein J6590_091097 [Homalodisca vitripennis]|nr:hypothetical protein J6590_091097 [Homalodisca vitripennis]